MYKVQVAIGMKAGTVLFNGKSYEGVFLGVRSSPAGCRWARLPSFLRSV